KKGVKITRNKRFGIKINKQSIVNQKSINAQEGYIFFSPKARMHKIILHLLSAIEPISSNKLAQSLFVRSEERRVGKEIITTRSKRDWSSDVCSSDLKKGVKITRNKRFGIKINKQSIVNQKSINAQEGYIFFSPKARMHKIILHLLSAIEPISSNKLAQSLFVTRRTIVDDLKSVEKWLADSFLELEYITNKGFSIKGEEQKVREAYAEILKKLYNIHDISSH